MKKPLILFCLLSAALSAVRAERADSFQKTVIRAADSSSSLVSKVTTLTGNVEIRRGTLLIQAEHAVLSEDAQGYQHVSMTTRPGEKPVAFRQKRDGGDNQWMEGEALQVEYDGKTEVVDLLNQAKVRRTTQGVLTDEALGEHIVYESLSEQYHVSQMPGAAGGDRRGTIVLQPGRKDPLISPASATASTVK